MASARAWKDDMSGSLLMFLQGGVFLHEAWHTILAEGDAVQKQVTVPVLGAVDSFCSASFS